MTRLSYAAAAVLVMLVLTVGTLVAQTAFVAPIKGEAEIQVLPIKAVPDFAAKMVKTVIRVKNASPTGSIVGLKVEQFWYDKANAVLTATSGRIRTPLKPGEEGKIELQLPYDAKMFREQYVFTHQNGKIKIKQVKNF